MWNHDKCHFSLLLLKVVGLAHSVTLIHFTEYVFAPLHAKGKKYRELYFIAL